MSYEADDNLDEVKIIDLLKSIDLHLKMLIEIFKDMHEFNITEDDINDSNQ